MSKKRTPLPFDLEEMQRVTDEYATRAVDLNREAAEVDRTQRNAIRDLIAEVTMLRGVNERLHTSFSEAEVEVRQFVAGNTTVADLRTAADKAVTVLGEETAVARHFYAKRETNGVSVPPGGAKALDEEEPKRPLPLSEMLANALETELNGDGHAK